MVPRPSLIVHTVYFPIAATPDATGEKDDTQDRETAEVKAHIDDMLEGWGGFDDDDE